jgi:hypothetical protein
MYTYLVFLHLILLTIAVVALCISQVQHRRAIRKLQERSGAIDKMIVTLLDSALVPRPNVWQGAATQDGDGPKPYPAGRVLYSLLRYLNLKVHPRFPTYIVSDPEDDFDFEQTWGTYLLSDRLEQKSNDKTAAE